MIVYNITSKVSIGIEKAWLQWQREEHIPEIMQTGLFTEFKIFHLLEQDDLDGSTYTIQYSANSMEDYLNYINLFANTMRQKAFAAWGNQFISFRSLMEVMH
jgi:hypothetical protein